MDLSPVKRMLTIQEDRLDGRKKILQHISKEQRSMQPHFAEMLKMLESGLFIMFSVYFIFSSLVCLHTGVYSVFLV